MKPHKKHTVTPNGYTGKNYNLWQRNLQRELDKLHKTNLADRFKVN